MYFYQVSAPNFSHPLPPIHVHVHVGSWWKSKLVRDWRSTCTHVHACQPALYQQWDNPHKLEGHAYGNSHDQTRTMLCILSTSVHTSMLNKCHVFYSLVRLLMLMLRPDRKGRLCMSCILLLLNQITLCTHVCHFEIAWGWSPSR